MKVIIATGGTGGHIYPALALAKEIKKDKNNEVLFIGSKSRMEARVIPDEGYDFIGLKMRGVFGNPFQKFIALITVYFSHFKCRKIIKDFKADAIVGFGSYVSFPVVFAGKKLKVPIVLHEQNALAGKANLFLAKYANSIVVSYQASLKEFPQEKVLFYGNPRASVVDITNNNRNDLIELGLRSDLKTVLIVMGSLGSDSVNQVVAETLPLFKDKDYQVIFVTGSSYYQKYQYLQSNNVKVLSYLDLLSYLNKIDLIVMRGGATTAAEVMAAGLPSVIIPSPYVANNHQVVNASELVKTQAAFMILESELNSEKLYEMINTIILDRDLLATMSMNAKILSKPDAAILMYQLLVDLSQEKHYG